LAGALVGRIVERSGSEDSMDRASSETTVEEEEGFGVGFGFNKEVILG
jgi:hypothetical protein